MLPTDAKGAEPGSHRAEETGTSNVGARSETVKPDPAAREQAIIGTLPAECPPVTKSFDAVERKLSLAFDALLDAIDTYRELKR